MRSYDAYCSVAKALDVVGERWTLLIVRELMISGPSRYTDLLHGLPGVASNLLVERLKELEEVGLVRREAAPPPVATTLFHLTDRGHALKPILEELGRWGAPLMVKPAEGEAFRSHWLVFPIELHLKDRTPTRPSIRIELRTGDEPMVVETVDGRIRARRGTVENPNVTLEGRPGLILGLLTGRLPLEEARKRGLQLTGDAGVLKRVVPDPA
ncbi:MAG: winged helix-turn-helix transcriptional regulator [Candidatus Dormibacteraceae bacterium]